MKLWRSFVVLALLALAGACCWQQWRFDALERRVDRDEDTIRALVNAVDTQRNGAEQWASPPMQEPEGEGLP
jgi:hypothetical protein